MIFKIHAKTKLGILRLKIDGTGKFSNNMIGDQIEFSFKIDEQHELSLKGKINEVKAGNIYYEVDEKSNELLESLLEELNKEDNKSFPELTLVKKRFPHQLR